MKDPEPKTDKFALFIHILIYLNEVSIIIFAIGYTELVLLRIQ